MKPIARAASVCALASSLYACGARPPEEAAFRSMEGLTPTHLEAAINACHSRGGGLSETGQRDFDGDYRDDHYAACADGRIFYTKSRRLLDGTDWTDIRAWFEGKASDYGL